MSAAETVETVGKFWLRGWNGEPIKESASFAASGPLQPTKIERVTTETGRRFHLSPAGSLYTLCGRERSPNPRLGRNPEPIQLCSNCDLTLARFYIAADAE